MKIAKQKQLWQSNEETESKKHLQMVVVRKTTPETLCHISDTKQAELKRNLNQLHSYAHKERSIYHLIVE